MRQAAVYVIVLMLPVVFASLVWPARRVWAIRATELLVALILSKFAIVAVLALGGAALSHGLGNGVAALLAGLVLVLLGAFAPWALLRLLPLHELASGAVGTLRAEARPAIRAGQLSDAIADDGDHWIQNLHSRMSREAEGTPGLASGRAAGNDDLVLAAGDSGHNSGFDATEGGSGQPEAENTPETASVAEPGQPPRAGAAAAETHPAEDPGSPRPTPSHAGRGTPSGPANPSRSTGLEAPELVLGLDGAWFRPDRPEDQHLDPFWSLPDEPTAEDGNRRDAEGVADEDDELPPRQRPEDVA